jgi:hypothetical protein
MEVHIIERVTLSVLGHYLTFIKHGGVMVIQESQLELIDSIGFHPILYKVDTQTGQLFKLETKVCSQYTKQGVLDSGVYNVTV